MHAHDSTCCSHALFADIVVEHLLRKNLSASCDIRSASNSTRKSVSSSSRSPSLVSLHETSCDCSAFFAVLFRVHLEPIRLEHVELASVVVFEKRLFFGVVC